MRWTDSAIHDLRSYNSYKRSIENLKERLVTLDMKMGAVRTSQMSQIPPNHGNGGRSGEDALIDAIVEKENIKLSLEIEERKFALIERGLSALTDEAKYVLTMFFVARPKNHVEIMCRKLHIEKATLYRLKDSALRQFTLEEYGIDI